MKKVTQIAAFMFIVVFYSAVSGCNGGNGENSSGIRTNASLQPVKSNVTIYFSIDKNRNKTYYESNHPAVVEVMQLVTNHCKTVDTRNYTALNFQDEYKLYTNDFANEMKKIENKILEYYKANQIVTKHSGIFWYEISFNELLTECSVKITDQFRYLEAKQGTKNAVNLKKIYSQSREYKLEKNADTWKIKSIVSGGEFIGNDFTNKW